MKKVLRSTVRGILIAAVLSAGLVTTANLSGADAVPVVCDVFDPNGVVLSNNNNGTWTWTLQGTGDCDGGFPENYDVTFSGSGLSNGLGICTGSATTLVLHVQVTLTNSSRIVQLNERWNVFLSPGVVATPFTVSNGGQGAGTIFNRIFGVCPGMGGTNASRVAWTQTF